MKILITKEIAQRFSVGLILIVIFSLGLNIRIEMVQKTIVDTPVRADAAQYYFYAYNLTEYGIYSLQSPNELGTEEPSPDAHRPPGYSLFLLPFVEFPPTYRMLHHIVVTQAVISTLTILVAIGFFRAFLSWPWSLVAATLVTLSPHLVAANIYVLTESLFTFFLTLLAWIMTKFAQRKDRLLAFIFGLTLGAALLVRPTLQYFIVFLIPALFVFFPKISKKNIFILIIFMLVGFVASYGPWVIRNIVVNPAGSTLAIDTIHKGIYPNLIYNNDPNTYGIPNRVDPEWEQRKDIVSVLKEISHRFKEEPVKYIYWYIVGKPTMFLSWNIVVGMGDVFIYPVHISPYHHTGWFYLSHKIMEVMHWPLVVLALLTSVAVWLPVARGSLSDNGLIVSRFVSLMIVYFILVHLVGTPLPRYSIPLRPLIYGMAVLGVHLTVKIICEYLAERRHKLIRVG